MVATSHDVARLAGVSQATVSRALRSVPGTSSETIARVRSVAESLGYIPSDAGRALSTRRTMCIGVVAGELTNPFYPELLQPIREEVTSHGYRLLLIPDSPESPLTLERMADGTFDGAIVATAEVNSTLPRELAQRGTPVVLANRVAYGPSATDTCAFDNASGAAECARLLVGLGHRNIGVIAGPRETSTGREREDAHLTTLNALGISLAPQFLVRGSFTFETGYQATLDLMTKQRKPTAILCGNDIIAIGACNALAHLGYEVGSDIAVVGFDDIQMASWDLYSLTTVRCDLRVLAAEAVRLILRRIESPDAPMLHSTIPTKLVQRSSTARRLRR